MLTVRSVFDLESFFGWIAAKSAVSIKAVQFHQRSGWYYFGVKYLDQRLQPPPIHIVASNKASVELAPEESRILQAFASAPDGTRAQIARGLGIPATTFQYQVERLVQDGIVAGVRCQIAPSIGGCQSFRALVRAGVLAENSASNHI